jgi:DNA polymerase I-like protein with 3'-5' exonuclease and polymerase domains
MTAIFDIETNGLYFEATELHCISIKLINGEQETKTCVYTSKPMGDTAGTLKEGLFILQTADLLVGHNIINFDIPVIKKLTGVDLTNEVLDTMLVSKLMYPDLMIKDLKRKSVPSVLKGKHKLEAWGYRLRKLKGEFVPENNADKWAKLTVDMIEYCRQDSEVTAALYQHLISRDNYPPKEAIWLEQEFAKIISRQEKFGCYFDMEKAKKLHKELLEEADKAEQELFKVFKPLKDWIPLKEYPELTTKKKPNKHRQNQVALGAHYNDNLEWGRWKEVVFNPGSRQHIARWLSEVYDWKPKEFTEKGSIVINEVVLNELEFPEGKILAHYFNVKKLLGQLVEGKNAWLNMVNNKTHRIHGSVDTLGAVSRRCTHSRPNMAQVPSGRAYKGHEARELFCVPKGKKLVGCDADGLELRTLSHYMARFDGGSYAKAVDEGKKDNGTDIHTINQKGAGLPTRDDAKTFIYAFLYGAGDGKIGEIVNGTANDGSRLKAKFFRQIPAIKKLVEQVTSVYSKTKTLKALDGNPYHIRSSHSALNTLLQGAGALVMKYWLIFLDKNLQKEFEVGKHYEFVLNVHDEAQIECDEDIAERVAKIAEDSFNDVTEYLKFRIPIRGTADIGDTWAETH